MFKSLCIALLTLSAVESTYCTAKAITDVATYREVAQRKSPVVIVFTSPSCGVCGPHMEALEKVAKKHNVEVYEFDVEKLPDLRKELGINYYPTTHFLPNGKKIDTGMDEARFEAEISELKGKKKEEVQTVAPRQATAPIPAPAQRRNFKRPVMK